jgi:hypothetical protein
MLESTGAAPSRRPKCPRAPGRAHLRRPGRAPSQGAARPEGALEVPTRRVAQPHSPNAHSTTDQRSVRRRLARTFPRHRLRTAGHELAHEPAIRRGPPANLAARASPHCAEPAGTGRARRRRGTPIPGRSHRRTTRSRPSLVLTRTTTHPSHTTSPHPTPEFGPQRPPPLGAAARPAAGHLHSQIRPKSVHSIP